MEASQEEPNTKDLDEDPAWTPEEIEIAYEKTGDDDNNDGSKDCEKPR